MGDSSSEARSVAGLPDRERQDVAAFVDDGDRNTSDTVRYTGVVRAEEATVEPFGATSSCTAPTRRESGRTLRKGPLTRPSRALRSPCQATQPSLPVCRSRPTEDHKGPPFYRHAPKKSGLRPDPAPPTGVATGARVPGAVTPARADCAVAARATVDSAGCHRRSHGRHPRPAVGRSPRSRGRGGRTARPRCVRRGVAPAREAPRFRPTAVVGQ